MLSHLNISLQKIERGIEMSGPLFYLFMMAATATELCTVA